MSPSPTGAPSPRPRALATALRLAEVVGGGVLAPRAEADPAPRLPPTATGDSGGREGVELDKWGRGAEGRCLPVDRGLTLTGDDERGIADRGEVRVCSLPAPLDGAPDPLCRGSSGLLVPAPGCPPTTAMTPVWTGSTGRR